MPAKAADRRLSAWDAAELCSSAGARKAANLPGGCVDHQRVWCLLALRGQAFNFSNESQISVLELVNLILRKMNSPLQPEVLNQASNEIRHQYLSAERARTILNWKPQFTLDGGLDRTIAWYREFLGAPAAMTHTAGR